MNRTHSLSFVAALSAALLAGCGGSSPERPDSRQLAEPPPATLPPRPPTPEEAMELTLPAPIAAAVEHWIADTSLGDAWLQAKGNVADLRARLVADYRVRQESGVGDTPASMALRRDYDLWLSIHDRLKVFILDCHARGEPRDLPPNLAKYFKDYSKLRREFLRNAPASLDTIEGSLAALQDDLAALRNSSETTKARLASAESIDSRAASLRAKAEGVRAGAEEVARHYATDEDVAALFRRAAEVVADTKALSAKTVALRGELRDAEAVRLFEEKVAAFERNAERLDELLVAKSARESEAKALSDAIVQAIRDKNFAALPEYRAKIDSLRANAKAARQEELNCARTVKGTAKNFTGTLGANAVETVRQTLASKASEARVASLSRRAETAAGRYGKTLASALLNLQTSAFRLEDDAAETAALAEVEKRFARLDALSKR